MTLPGPTVLYDGECGLCHRSVKFLLKRDRHQLWYAPLQGETAARSARSTRRSRKRSSRSCSLTATRSTCAPRPSSTDAVPDAPVALGVLLPLAAGLPASIRSTG